MAGKWWQRFTVSQEPASAGSTSAERAHPLLPPEIVARLERYGRFRVDRYTAGEPDPLDPAWEPIIPTKFETDARTDPERYVDALAEVVGPVGGWSIYGAAEFALDIGDHDLESPAYRTLFVGGLMVRREAGVPWPMLNGFDQVYWNTEHAGEPWQPTRQPPKREEAAISPLEVGQEREIARVSGGEDPKVILATRPSADRYALVIEHPRDDGPPARGEMFAADNLYDVYVGVGMEEHALAHFWNDAEFEPFCRHLWPRL